MYTRRENQVLDTQKMWHLLQHIKKMCLCPNTSKFCGNQFLDTISLIVIIFSKRTRKKTSLPLPIPLLFPLAGTDRDSSPCCRTEGLLLRCSSCWLACSLGGQEPSVRPSPGAVRATGLRQRLEVRLLHSGRQPVTAATPACGWAGAAARGKRWRNLLDDSSATFSQRIMPICHGFPTGKFLAIFSRVRVTVGLILVTKSISCSSYSSLCPVCLGWILIRPTGLLFEQALMSN